MKLIYEITVFPLISTLSLYLISNLFGEVLIRGQNFAFVLFNNENETQNLETKQKQTKKNKKQKKNQKNINNSFIVWVLVKPYDMNSYEF